MEGHAVFLAEREEVARDLAVARLEAVRVQVLVQELQLARRPLRVLELLLQQLLVRLERLLLGPDGLPPRPSGVEERLRASELEEVLHGVHPEEPVEGLVPLPGLVEEEAADAALLQEHGAHERVHVEAEERVALRLALLAAPGLVPDAHGEALRSTVPRDDEPLAGAQEHHLTRERFPPPLHRREERVEADVGQHIAVESTVEDPLQRERDSRLPHAVVAVHEAGAAVERVGPLLRHASELAERDAPDPPARSFAVACPHAASPPSPS